MKAQVNEFFVLVAIANDQALFGFQVRHCNEQFRFAANFETMRVLFAKVGDVVNDVGLLIDFDREHAAINVLVSRISDGFCETLI